MRFIEHGPSIPNELLIARDEGRVVFFCGAGVSRAKAGLSDFEDLVKKVLDECHIRNNDDIRKVFKGVRRLNKWTKMGGLVSIDRIFGLLEQQFDEDLLQEITARALKPSDPVDLSAHQTLLDLATTAEGVTRIVTTNFDRLFEAAAKEAANKDASKSKLLNFFQPPRLPDMAFNGIVHLHGLAKPTYDGAEGQGFVLTSSSYGKAYLAEGWATQFVQAILQQYIVVFIGYRADDPPIQYLLEALRKTPELLQGVYAFQDGEKREAHSKWAHKGVKAIAYDGENRHSALWKTLEAWAKRAQSLEGWRQTVLDLAKQDPKTLKPFERGQVAHLVSTTAGAKAFAETADLPPAPPAEWLCVFDAYRRYAKPFSEDIGMNEFGEMYDPFDDYGLDSDSLPQRISAEDSYQKERKVPDNAWGAFKPSPQESQIPHFIFYGNVGNLSPRLNQLAIWLGKVADQPTAVWWASHYRGLHSQVQARISWEILHGKKTINPVIRQAWGYLFEIWRDEVAFRHTAQHDIPRPFDEFRQIVNIDGWSSQVLRQYAAMTRPYLAVQFSDNPKPPLLHESPNMSDLLDLNVKYFNRMNDIEIPDEWLAGVIAELRKHLEYALQLQNEIGCLEPFSIGSILQPEPCQLYGTTFLYNFVIQFYRLFRKFVEFDKLDYAAVRKELAVWLNNEDALFLRLTIAAAETKELVSNQVFISLVLKLDDDLFWNYYYRNDQNDLLYMLANRWNCLTVTEKKTLEHRLLAGIKRQDGVVVEDFNKQNALLILDRLDWLQNQGCLFTFDLAAEIQRLQVYAPEWRADKVNVIAKSRENPSKTEKRAPDKDCAELLSESLANILSKANKLACYREDNPYREFCERMPRRSFSALTHADKQDNFPLWEWETFLYSGARKNDKPKFSALIAEWVASYIPAEELIQVFNSITHWIRTSGETLAVQYPTSYYKLIDKLIQATESTSSTNSEVIKIECLSNWIANANESLVSYLPRLMFIENLERIQSVNIEQLLQLVEKLLALPGDLRCYVLFHFAPHFEQLYSIDTQWTKANLLAALSSNDHHKSAFLAGFIWQDKIPQQNIYLKLKPEMLRFAKEEGLGFEFKRRLIVMILDSWLNKCNQCNERLLTDDELHDVILHGGDELRRKLIWHIQECSKKEDWLNQLPDLFNDVWPKRLSVKTPETSQALLKLAFSNVDIFKRIADPILPLISCVTYSHLEISGDILQFDSTKVLALLDKAFAETHHTRLPFQLEDVLEQIVEIDPLLRKDSRWLKLKRKIS